MNQQRRKTRPCPNNATFDCGGTVFTDDRSPQSKSNKTGKIICPICKADEIYYATIEGIRNARSANDD